MALTDQVLRADSLSSDGGKTYLSLGLPWFRSLPWGAVSNLTITIDGETFPAEALSVRFDEATAPIRLTELQESEREWFVQDRHSITIDSPTAPGSHRVRAAFQLVMPNLMMSPTQPISLPSIVEKELVTH